MRNVKVAAVHFWNVHCVENIPKMLIWPLLLTACVQLFGQPILIRGQLVDTRGTPIPFGTVEIRHPDHGTGVAANESGEFAFSVPPERTADTLLISALGFDPKKIPIREVVRNKPLKIVLAARIFEMEEVVVRPSASKGTMELGHSRMTPEIYGGMQAEHLTQIGVWMDNPAGQSGMLQTISFFITRSGKPRSPFRVRIYAAEGDPVTVGEDMLTESLIFEPAKKGAWNTLDVSGYRIPFPEKGLFVAIEYIYTKKKFEYKTVIGDHIYADYGVVLGCTWEYAIPRSYLNYLGKGWKLWYDPGTPFGLPNPRNALIKITVSY